MSVRQEIFVTQLGRKFRLFLSTVQRYENFKALPNYIAQKARKKARALKSLTECGHYGQLSIVINVLKEGNFYNYNINIFIYILI